MPRIIPYEQRVSVSAEIGGRAARASDFGGGAAGLAQAGKELESFADRMQDNAQRQEVSDVAARMAKARAEWTVELQNRALAAPAGDTSFADKFKTDFSDYMAGQGEGISTVAGRRAFQQHSAELAAHFVERAGVYQANSIGAKAVQDYKTLVDANRSTLLNDPSQYEAIRDQTVAALDDPSGSYYRMPAAKREELKRTTLAELGLSTVQGIIRQDPEEAKRQLEAGEWSGKLDADKEAALLRGAEFAINARKTDADRARLADERAKKEQQRTTANNLYTDFVANKLTMDQVMNSNLEAFGENSKEHFRQLIATANKPDTAAAVSRETTTDLYRRMMLPEDDPSRVASETELDRAFIDGKVTRTDLDWLRKQYGEARTAEGSRLTVTKKAFFDGVKAQIDKSNPLMGKMDPSGGQQFYHFQVYAEERAKQYRAEGKNPYDLFNPISPDYLGKPETLGMFQRPIQDSMKEIQRRMRPPAPGQKRPSLDDIFRGKR